MKPDVGARADRAPFGRRSGHVVQAHRDAISVEQLIDASVVPAGIAEFHDMVRTLLETRFRRNAMDRAEKSFQPIEVDAEVRWELVEDRTQSRTKFPDVLEETKERVVRVL